MDVRYQCSELRTVDEPDGRAEPDFRDTLPDIHEDTFAPVETPQLADLADLDDLETTVRMSLPVRAFGRDTAAGALVLLLGLGMVGYAAAGPPPRTLRALASGATFHAIELPVAAAVTAEPAPLAPVLQRKATSMTRAATPTKRPIPAAIRTARRGGASSPL